MKHQSDSKLASVIFSKWFSVLTLAALAVALAGCRTANPLIGKMEPRTGDEIVAAGKFFHTGTPVVLWMDPGGYDAYRVERRFSPYAKSDWKDSTVEHPDLTTPNRYGLRASVLTPDQIEKVRGGGWDLPLLQSVVDQFVLHFDECSISKLCFMTLQDDRDLSVHFMLDIDGTIYQTLDCKERAWQATTSNSRSIGIEIANTGAFRSTDARPFKRWYRKDEHGRVTISLPPEVGDSMVRTPNFVGHPARPDFIKGNIQGRDLAQYDYTPQQYAALVKLTATLCKVFPMIRCDYPKDESGKLITHKLPDDVLNNYQGVLGHYHVQTNKEDPGPAFNWDYVIGNARRYLGQGFSPMADITSRGKAGEMMDGRKD